ncbi:kinase-like protein [Ceratobasidium sp. AG-I]|nr:kinase-like protein [Ceratobasidium sp. AG-I]
MRIRTPSTASSLAEPLPVTITEVAEKTDRPLCSGIEKALKSISRTMSAREVIETLGEHGCPDVTPNLDLNRCKTSPIAHGGFGEVHEGWFSNGTRIAIKCPRMNFNMTKEGYGELKSMAHEIYAWSKCRHPNVLEPLGLAEFRGQMCLVSPWMEFGSVLQYLDFNPDTDRYPICAQISRGLAYLHKENVIHGDLKGGNVFISEDGIAKIADFGNTVLKDYSVMFTGTRIHSSTLRWTAPELLEAKNGHTVPGDVYALGMTIFEVITGRRPYDNMSDPAVIFMMFSSPRTPERPTDCIPLDNFLADALWTLLGECWSYDANSRPLAAEVEEMLSIITKQGLSETASCIPEMWEYHVEMTKLNSGNTTSGRDQCMVILSQFKEGIDASYLCIKKHAGGSEIKELHSLLKQTKLHYEAHQHFAPAQTSQRDLKFDRLLDHISQALDDLLARFEPIVGRQFQSTIAMIRQIRTEGEVDEFSKAIGNASLRPEGLEISQQDGVKLNSKSKTEQQIRDPSSSVRILHRNERPHDAAKPAATGLPPFAFTPIPHPESFFSISRQSYPYVQAMWGYYNHMKSLGINIGRNQRKVLLDQFAEGINAADQCEKQLRGLEEIQELHDLLKQTDDHYVFCRSLHWSQVGYKKQEFDYRLDQITRALDGLLMRFGMLVGRKFHFTNALIHRARMEDDSWFDRFIKQIDQASPHPEGLVHTYRSQDTNSMNRMIDPVLQNQGQALSQDAELQEEEEEEEEEEVQAQEFTKWIMSITNQKLKPGLILGRRIVGELEHLLTTERNVIYKAKFVSGETVALKVPQAQMQGKNLTAILTRFQDEVHLWHTLRYDQILPFYGVGARQEAGRTQVYGVSPYLPNGDVLTYRQLHPLSVEESLQIANDVALALRYLHERDVPIVHFNVCSRNVLIDNDGRALLGGFGFSQELSASEDQATADHGGLPTDVTRFRAPEHHNDSGFPVKASADAWGWAMTALELVGGKAPFCEMQNEFQAVTAMVRGERPDRGVYRDIQPISDSDALWGLLEDCWAHDEVKRPSMDEVVTRMKGIKERFELGRRAPVVPGPTPRRRAEEHSLKPVVGRNARAYQSD